MRALLADAIARESADLVVLTAHGRTQPRGASCGSVASYLVSHLPVPLVVLRDGHPVESFRTPAVTSGEPRHPARAH